MPLSGGSSASNSDQDAGKPMGFSAPTCSIASLSQADPALQIMPPVMTSNRARRELIQLPTVTISVKVRLLSTRPQSGTVPGTVAVPDLSGDGDAQAPSPRPRPRFVGSGTSPVPDSHRGRLPVGGPDTTVGLGRSGCGRLGA